MIAVKNRDKFAAIQALLGIPAEPETIQAEHGDKTSLRLALPYPVPSVVQFQ
jgi:hypothetical protein